MSLQRNNKCFQIKSFHNIYTCERIVKNPEARIYWIMRKYHNKRIVDFSFFVDNMIIDIKQICGVEVVPQKAYGVKRKILESAGGKDHVQSFNDLWDYVHIIK